ncbi:3-hydroxyisobutyrate dehydrogenase [Rhodotorula diobovata]|uniref:3-hydroxyisobutyrate dehydrogenase n=1 Tax=Rhodotorula diobovata TaxID=5288 RepID=A0A5C5FZR4_9BASI|nr:3-hydroxyisobutyrate dehydrogenase [Rhodotorula diobovata]
MRPTVLLRHINRADTIGFLGLGAMGRGMAANLLNKTFSGQQGVYAPDKDKPSFVVYDAFPPALSTFLDAHTRAYAGRDVLPASSPAGVARLAGTIVTMLPSKNEVEEVYCGENGLFEALEALSDDKRRETLLIDCTTGEREHSIEVARRARDLGVEMVDAPVSGGVVGAEKGTLSFMVGGSEQGFNRAQPHLAKMGARFIHCGASGNGLAVKICNNLLLGISMVGTAEAMLLGKSLGLAPELLASVINTSTGRCWASEVNNPAPGALPNAPAPADRGYVGGFLSKLMSKDLQLALTSASHSSTPLPLGQLAGKLYERLGARPEFAERDFSVVYEYLSEAREGVKAAKEERGEK